MSNPDTVKEWLLTETNTATGEVNVVQRITDTNPAIEFHLALSDRREQQPRAMAAPLQDERPEG